MLTFTGQRNEKAQSERSGKDEIRGFQSSGIESRELGDKAFVTNN